MRTMKPGRECGTFDKACERAAEYANRPHTNHPGTNLELAETFLKRAGCGHAIFGIEYVSCADRELAYLNTGDTYSLTIAQEGEDGEVFATSWGDWLEEAEQEHCEAEDVIRCAYCGEFTPNNGDDNDWHDTVCEHCGRYVDSGDTPEQRAVRMAKQARR